MKRTAGRMLLAAAAAWALSAAAAERGALVIVGGGLDAQNEAVHRAVLGTRLPELPLCVISVASEAPAKAAESAVAEFERFDRPGGVRAVDLSSPRSEGASIAEELGRCGGFWFTDGDPARIVDVLLPGGGRTPAFDAIEGVHLRGGGIAGTGAGAAMMSDPMIAGGEPIEALTHPVSSSASLRGVRIRSGTGFLEEGLAEPHALSEGRVGRLLAVLNVRSGIPFAVGVDGNTALVIRGSRADALGSGNVVVVDVRGAERGADGTGFERARMWVLGDGDRFDLDSGVAAPAADKTPVARANKKPIAPALPFKNDAFARFLGDLSRYFPATATMPAGRYSLEVTAGSGAQALSRPKRGPYNVPTALFLGPVSLTLMPRAMTSSTER